MRYFRIFAIAPSLALPAAAMSLPAPMPASAPRLPITSFEQLPKPLPLPYDEKADAERAVAAARQKALKERKLLLIDLGGNWCLDCRLLAGTMEIAPLKAWLAKRYEIVTVDVGRFDKNLQIAVRYGAGPRPAGVPALLIVDPRTDRLVNKDSVTALADARSSTPQGLANWLARWVR